jgi:hypothetical protein
MEPSRPSYRDVCGEKGSNNCRLFEVIEKMEENRFSYNDKEVEKKEKEQWILSAIASLRKCWPALSDSEIKQQIIYKFMVKSMDDLVKDSCLRAKFYLFVANEYANAAYARKEIRNVNKYYIEKYGIYFEREYLEEYI